MPLRDLPRVEIREQDRSEALRANLGVIPAFFMGPADRGPVNEATDLADSNEFLNTFGRPTSEAGMGAYLYLQKTQQPTIFVRTYHQDFSLEVATP